MNETQPRPLYDVFCTWAKPDDTPERLNDAPLGVFDAIEFAATYVAKMQDVGWRLDGTPITSSSARQRWHLHKWTLKAVVDVVEVQS